MLMTGPRHVMTAVRQLARSRSAAIGSILFLLIVLPALLSPVIAPYSPIVSNYQAKLLAPSSSHWLGTDHFGRDLFTRMLYGARVSLGIGAAVVACNAVIGTLLGAVCGYFTTADTILMRIVEALMAFPAILLAMVISAVLGGSIFNVVIALSIATIPYTTRIVRASVLVLREMEYVEAARALGAGAFRILFGHVLINGMAPLIVRLTYVFAIAILSESALSYLGAGPQPPTPTLGNIIANGRDFAATAPWIMMFPGIAIIVVVLGLNLLGDGLRDLLDPRTEI
jgi:peptide/nickel transport system permease protein